VNRRSLLTSVALALATRRLPLPSYTAVARADEKSLRHGLALFGDFKYPAGFKQFDYVNASAPKGGTVRQIALGTYDSFNIVVDGVKGALVLGIDLNYDTLLVPALDEVASEYGLLAEAVSYPDDFSSASFRLRATAKWHDSTPVTPEDVIFSFETFRKLSPQAGANYQHVAKAEKVGNREVTFTFDGPGNRSLPQVLGQFTVLQRAWWEGTDTDGSVRQRWCRHLAPVRTALRNSPSAAASSTSA
jgi:microcin C transport system substrate-binding protein